MSRVLDRSRARLSDGLKAMVPLDARKRLVRARLRARQVTASHRALPGLLVIGAQRCGTSSLYKYLGRHPDVVSSLRKETGYLADRFIEGPLWYRAHFPMTARLRFLRPVGRELLTFEATPDYMLDPRSAPRAADLVPDARVVALLRDPVSRAYSHYGHNRRLGLEPLSFEDALAAEADRIGPDLAAVGQDPTHPALALRRFSYVARGNYAEQLRLWFDHYPRQQILIVPTAELFGEPAGTFRRITEFLGLREWVPPSFENYSYAAGQAGTASPPMTPATRTRLVEEFRRPNRDLAELLGEGEWWPGDGA